MPHDEALLPEAQPVISAEFPGTPLGVREALGAAKTEILRLGAEEEEAFSAELVLAEALNNVVEHALAEAAAPVFELVLKQSPRGICVEILDAGLPMPDGKPPLGDTPLIADETASLAEGGFGWFLIRELARDLTYSRAAGMNRLSFRLAICAAAEAA